jgi:hypothetical protein
MNNKISFETNKSLKQKFVQNKKFSKKCKKK